MDYTTLQSRPRNRPDVNSCAYLIAAFLIWRISNEPSPIADLKHPFALSLSIVSATNAIDRLIAKRCSKSAIGDRLIADVRKLPCIETNHEFNINKTAGAPATAYFSCFGDPGHFFQTAENVSGKSRLKTTPSCRNCGRRELWGGTRSRESCGFYSQVAHCTQGIE